MRKNIYINIDSLHLNTRVVQMFVVFILVVFLPACVTTGGGSAFSDKQDNTRLARKTCTSNTDENRQVGQNPNQGDKKRSDCLPPGVIEIYENSPVDSEVREEFHQAVVFLNQEKYSEAIKLLKAVSGKTSKFSAPYINLGIAYGQIGELKKAEEYLNRALEISPQHPAAKNELGLIYRKTGRYAKARELYEKSLAVYPDFLPIRKNLGVLCDIYIQDLNCAIQQYEEYLKSEPGDEKVKIWVADVKSRM
jgi:tetratricopeptide (TPR) repeat protein